jgi:thioredoxin-related protein
MLLLPFDGLASAAELVMVNSRACYYCARFHREVGKYYSETDAGRSAPLRKVSRLKKWPEDLSTVTPVYYTPVFILVEDGREVGRFPGYTDEESFWEHLNPLLAQLETTPEAVPDRPTTGGLW